MTDMTITLGREPLSRALAGALAERSVTSLTFARPDAEPRTLSPRETDLPALLRQAPDGTRLTTPGGSTVTLTRTGCTISSTEQGLVESVISASR